MKRLLYLENKVFGYFDLLFITFHTSYNFNRFNQATHFWNDWKSEPDIPDF